MAGRFGGIVRGASGGLSRLAAALGGGDVAEQQGYDSAMQGQSKIGLTLAQMAAARAKADEDAAKAEQTRLQTGMLANRPSVMEEQAALAGGVDVPTVRAFRQQLQTGQAPDVPMGPEAPDGSMGMGRAQFPPQLQTRLAQALTRLAPLSTNTGDIKVDDWAKALGAFREADLGDQVIAGALPAATVGRSQAAVAGKPLFNADSTGAVLDLFGGALGVDNPMAQGTIKLRGAQAGQAAAAAAENYAQAGAARALEAERRQSMTDGVNRGGARAPAGYRWGADGMTLEAIPGGPADPNTKGAKLAKPPTEGQAKALMFGTRMAVADEVLKELDGKYSAGAVAAAKGADAMPLIGGIAGRIATASLGPEGQQALQAQRDFINAILRRESGAVISDQEFANAALQYFPQPGDSPQVLRQKAANRRTAIAGMRAEFGEAMAPEFDKIVGEARNERRRPAQPARPAAEPSTGSVSGSWGDGWKIERVN